MQINLAATTKFIRYTVFVAPVFVSSDDDNIDEKMRIYDWVA
jgi:hypothetical protein